MSEAAGIKTAPLDLSEQEWPLLSGIVDLPPKIIPPPDNHKPPIISNYQRKRSSRCSRTKAPVSDLLPAPESKSPETPSTIQDNVETSSLVSPPSPSTTIYLMDKGIFLFEPPSPTHNLSHNVEPNTLEPLPSMSQNINAIKYSDFKPNGHDEIIKPPLSPPPHDLQQLSYPTSYLKEISNSCWISIAEATD